MIHKERFVEDDPETLRWNSEPVTPGEEERARQIFWWLGQH